MGQTQKNLAKYQNCKIGKMTICKGMTHNKLNLSKCSCILIFRCFRGLEGTMSERGGAMNDDLSSISNIQEK